MKSTNGIADARDLNRTLGQMISLQDEIAKIEADAKAKARRIGDAYKFDEMKGEVDAVNAVAEKKAKTRVEKLALLEGSTIEFARKNQGELLASNGRGKTIFLENGQVKFQKQKATVDFEKEEEDTIIGRLETTGSEKFVKVKKTIDKNALISQPKIVEAIEGLKLTEHDDKVTVVATKAA